MLDRYNTTQFKISRWLDADGNVKRVGGMIILPGYETEYREDIVERWKRGGGRKVDSEIIWHPVLWESFTTGNVAPIDMLFFSSLRKIPTAARLYRISHRPISEEGQFTFEIVALAKQVGISIPLAQASTREPDLDATNESPKAKYHAGKLKNRLEAGFKALVERKYLDKELKSDRYWKDKDTGLWSGRVYRAKTQVQVPSEQLEARRILLSLRNFNPKVAESIAKEHVLDHIRTHVEHARWLKGAHPA